MYVSRECCPLDAGTWCDDLLAELVRSVGLPALLGLEGLKKKDPIQEDWRRTSLELCDFAAEMK